MAPAGRAHAAIQSMITPLGSVQPTANLAKKEEYDRSSLPNLTDD